MFQPISTLFKNEVAVWDEQDVKYFVQQYLQGATKSDQVYCQAVAGGVAMIRAASPALVQAVILLEYDLCAELEAQAHYILKRVRIVR